MAEMRESNNLKISEKALYIMRKTVERCLEDRFCLTLEQAKTETRGRYIGESLKTQSYTKLLPSRAEKLV
ncbi:hypothetical protein BpJC7_10370 [Weizmannia acidilactici]|uniref:Uncharacterized protein n=1 Tax=Weizmannia acidilactici TaxID=2607726 RepID=A0A5J4JL64_9BACI|nr:hypothetical protein BpJC4_04080 [Weizmannia acidilactici]GER69734.1 hypothetical protein BpJC7_10370 [Weizmannia acidilactici]GER74393.1 hypothetical protein BpPP18_24600 [Weizmannia acidilactici]